METIANSTAYIEFEQKHARHINMMQESVRSRLVINSGSQSTSLSTGWVQQSC